jgi:hypothetical protein
MTAPRSGYPAIMEAWIATQQCANCTPENVVVLMGARLPYNTVVNFFPAPTVYFFSRSLKGTTTSLFQIIVSSCTGNRHSDSYLGDKGLDQLMHSIKDLPLRSITIIRKDYNTESATDEILFRDLNRYDNMR